MAPIADMRVVTRRKSSFEPSGLNRELYGDLVKKSKDKSRVQWLGWTIPTTYSQVKMPGITSPSFIESDGEESAAGWDKFPINREPVVSNTRASTETSAKVTDLSRLLRLKRRDERLRSLSPDRRAIFDRIRKLRTDIGPIDFDVVEALRELRANG